MLFSHEHYSNIYWNDNQITTNLDAFLALVGGDINLMLVSIFWSEWFVGKLFSNLIWTGLSNHLFLAILAINCAETKLCKNRIVQKWNWFRFCCGFLVAWGIVIGMSHCTGSSELCTALNETDQSVAWKSGLFKWVQPMFSKSEAWA